jgi:acyl-CoA synthetase (NDP forming)
VASFIVVLQAEILESYVEALKSIDYRGKPIIACVTGKEFAMPDVIRMENAGILVLSTPEQVADALAIMYRHQKRVKAQGGKGSVSRGGENKLPPFSYNCSLKSVLISGAESIFKYQ